MPPATSVAAHSAAVETSAFMTASAFGAESAAVADFTFVAESTFAADSTFAAESILVVESTFVADFAFVAELSLVAESALGSHSTLVAEGAFVPHSDLGHRGAARRAESVLAVELRAAERVTAEGQAAVSEVVVPLAVDDVRAVEFVEPAEVPMDLVVAPVEAAP